VANLTVTHENLLGRNTEFWPIVICDINHTWKPGNLSLDSQEAVLDKKMFFLY
jgi:hypothetical protein